MSIQREVGYRLSFLEKTTPRGAAPAAMLLLVLLWQGLAGSGLISELYLPAPSSILRTAVEMLASGEIWLNLEASLLRILCGFFIGSAIGVCVGLLFGFSTLVETLGNPILYSLYPIPKIALLPLIILWLGIGEISKVAIIALGVFFPVAINTYSGVKHIDPLFIKVAVTFRAGRLNIIRKVILPGALPMMFTGFKLAAGTSLLLLVAAEMIAAKEGIGALILHYGDLMLTTKLMVGVLVLSILGVVFNQLLDWLERRLVPWKQLSK